MGKYTGTDDNDTITPDMVSSGVIAKPTNTRPSAVDDSIWGKDGADTLDGGGGRDNLHAGMVMMISLAGRETIASSVKITTTLSMEAVARITSAGMVVMTSFMAGPAKIFYRRAQVSIMSSGRIMMTSFTAGPKTIT